MSQVRAALSDLSCRLGAPFTHELIGHAVGHVFEDRMEPLLNGAARDEHYGLAIYQDGQACALLDP